MVCLIVTLAILVITYTLLVTELVDPTLAVLVGGIIMSIVVKVFASFGAIPGVDLELIENETIAQLKNVLLLLFGMMIIVSVLSKTGFFQWSAIKAYDLAGCRVKPLIVLLMVFTAILSAFMDNVTTILLMAPVTLELAKLLKIKAVPLLIGEATASNIGGAATLIGDPPHIILGGAAHLTFMDFIINLTPIVVVIFVIFVVIILKVMRDPDRKEGEQCGEIDAIRKMYIIKDEILFKRIALHRGHLGTSCQRREHTRGYEVRGMADTDILRSALCIDGRSPCTGIHRCSG
jgi:Na+/H+ antiporter NhaD/arsenite permease-like protein